MSTDRTAIDHAVKEWLRLDRDPETIAQITSLHAAGSYDELSARLSSRIAFGTAGLRAKMQAGTAFMNSLVILQATQGLARYACRAQSNARERGVVVGHDHRHRSKLFAQLAAGVFRREGMKVWLLDGLVHTPMIPFAVTELGCAVGLMITASHNPAADNGYKVYWENAVQIIPPHDAGIAAEIDASLEVSPEAFVISTNPEHGGWEGTEEMKGRYIKMTESLSVQSTLNAKSTLLFTYTAMHGVGLPFAQSAFDAAGFPSSHLSIVQEQAQPDPDFPTVKFPNPEEKGALVMAIAHAERVGSNIVLANDPDADRFCAAEKSSEGSWTVFTGDQLGNLLGEWVLTKYKSSGQPINKLAMCASAVSSKMLGAIARTEGFTFRETLTGFKYLGNEALEMEKEGLTCLFAYEEAIGYMHGSTLRDKDGVTALVSFCELAVMLSENGRSVAQHLDSLYDKYGYFKTSNSYFICRDPIKTSKIFSLLRYSTPTPPTNATHESLRYPKTLAGYPITSIRDLTTGYDSSNPPSFSPSLPVDPKSHMLSFSIGSPSSPVRVQGTIRTSGTEPKIKYYLEAEGMERGEVERVLSEVREAVGVEWMRSVEMGLESP